LEGVHPQKAFGAAIGEALLPLEKGRGLIPILIALQQDIARRFRLHDLQASLA
jgi:hypothetical protein